MENRESVVEWLDSLPKPTPTTSPRYLLPAASTCRRILEEAVELCLAAGLSYSDVLVAVADSTVSQIRKEPPYTYPSTAPCTVDRHAVHEEATDIQILLWHLWLQEARTEEPSIPPAGLGGHEQRALDKKMTKLRATTMLVQPDGSYYRKK